MTSWKEENVLTGFIMLSLICHGMFFLREWLIWGLILLGYTILRQVKKHKAAGKAIGAGKVIGHEYKGEHLTLRDFVKRLQFSNPITVIRKKACKKKICKLLFNPRAIFILLIVFSLLGLLCNPVRRMQGWFEAWRWLVFFLVYLWGQSLSAFPDLKEKIIDRILLISIIITIISLSPCSEMIWASSGFLEQGRFALSFGYANAAGVYLGCQLLLLQRKSKFNSVLGLIFLIGLVYSGSRAAFVLLLIFSLLLKIKKESLNYQGDRAVSSLGFIGFNMEEVEKERSRIIIPLAVMLCWTLSFRFDGSWQHLLNWEIVSWEERLYYYLDSWRIAWNNSFLPSAGGWLAFPFLQTVSYWTLNPHSSLCSILINQGLAGLVLLLIWSVRGFLGYVQELVQGKDMTAICCKSTVVYLGLHSLIDVDLSFGTLGILFWLLVGMYSK
ncbi:MAG: hypothetical protein GX207_04720 [Peptococcaceae bacterium]|nr:hypothetical protein [Peptococcaceae bacterium]